MLRSPRGRTVAPPAARGRQHKRWRSLLCCGGGGGNNDVDDSMAPPLLLRQPRRRRCRRRRRRHRRQPPPCRAKRRVARCATALQPPRRGSRAKFDAARRSDASNSGGSCANDSAAAVRLRHSAPPSRAPLSLSPSFAAAATTPVALAQKRSSFPKVGARANRGSHKKRGPPRANYADDGRRNGRLTPPPQAAPA